MSSELASSVELYWIPLGAGARVVRRSGRCFEALSASLARRPRCDLYHSALRVRSPEGSFVIEMTPVPAGEPTERGVVAGGAVGMRWAGRLRLFRYEVRCWRDGRIPDLAAAVGGGRLLSEDADRTRRVLSLVPEVPTAVWGRDELGAGEMWNSNSVISWVLARAGFELSALRPPAGGRAPGWDAGVAVAERQMLADRHRADGPPASLPEAARRVWAALSTPATTARVPFDPDQVTALPTPVARWLRHAIAPGTPLGGGVTVSMHGRIRIGRWLPFTAQQIVAPNGYLWAAEAGWGPIKIRGFDRYSTATGQMSWRLLGRIPVVSSAGPDITRSAAGRLASELIGLTPAGALSPSISWRGIDDHRATATVTIDGEQHSITVDIDDRGALRSISLPRWAKPDSEPFQLHTFGVLCEGELTTAGQTLPHHLRAGWWFGTAQWDKGEFFRATIDGATFF